MFDCKGSLQRIIIVLICLPVISLFQSSLKAQCNWYHADMSGEKAKSQFGFCVNAAGFVNADSIADVVIGAPGYYEGVDTSMRTGAVYVKSIPTYNLIWKFVGEQAADSFGYSVDGAGDINNDGFDDIIVGAPYYDKIVSDPVPDTSFSSGRVYIFSGVDGSPLLVINGEVQLDKFGFSVAGAGDMNGDEFDDIVVGAPGFGIGGKVYIFLGGGGYVGDTISAGDADHTVTGSQTDGLLGWSVSGADDWNYDCDDDIVVGSPGYNGGTGKATVYTLESDNLQPLIIYEGEFPGERFGHSVAGAGDINGDCYYDIIIGAPNYDTVIVPTPYPDIGRAVTFAGGDYSGNWFHEIVGNNTGDSLGYSVDGAGDRNFDGYDEIVVGAPGYDDFSRGQVCLVMGSGSSPGTRMYASDADIVIYGYNSKDQLGFSVSGAGDADEDAADEQIYGAPQTHYTTGYAGVAYIDTCSYVLPAPRNVNITNPGTGHALIVSWDPPESSEGTLDYYRITLQDSPPPIIKECCEFPLHVKTAAVGDTAVGFNNLNFYQPYYAYVQAIYTDGRKSAHAGTPGDMPGYPTFPVVCVHGFASDETTWNTYKGWLEESNFNIVWLADNLDKWGESNERYFSGNAENLSNFIEDSLSAYESEYASILSGAPFDTVDIIAHSMGGLISRRYISESSAAWCMAQKDRWVRNLIMLASPHGGTLLGEMAYILKKYCSKFCFLGNIFCTCEDILLEFPAVWELSVTEMSNFNGNYQNHEGVDYYMTYSSGGRDDDACGGINMSCEKTLQGTTRAEICPNDGIVSYYSATSVIFDNTSYYPSICHTAINENEGRIVYDDYVIKILTNDIDFLSTPDNNSPDGRLIEGEPQKLYQFCDSVVSSAGRVDTLHITEYGWLTLSLTRLKTGLDFSLTSPSSFPWDSAAAENYPAIAHYVSDSFNVLYTFNLTVGSDADTGLWLVQYHNVDSTQAFCLTASMGESSTGSPIITFSTALDPQVLTVDDTVWITGTLTDDFGDPIPWPYAEVYVKIEREEGGSFYPVDSLELYDSDDYDGVYTNWFYWWPEPGLYLFSFYAESTPMYYIYFTRQNTMSLNILPSLNIVCGDANGNETLNILDIVYIISYIYKNGPAPIPYECAGDANGNSDVNILDITYLIAFLYKSGPPPVDDCCAPIW